MNGARSSGPDEPGVGETARLERLRARIDQLDQQLVDLLSQRAACALEIGAIKSAAGVTVYQPDREREVMAHVSAVNKGPLGAAALIRVFERIVDETRRLEREARERDRRGPWGREGE